MKFIEGFFALMVIAAGMIFAAFELVMHWLLQTAMFIGAGIIISLNIFALLVWFVNWRYYPEQK